MNVASAVSSLPDSLLALLALMAALVLLGILASARRRLLVRRSGGAPDGK